MKESKGEFFSRNFFTINKLSNKSTSIHKLTCKKEKGKLWKTLM